MRLNQRWARRIRLGVTSTTIMSVPSFYLLANGPYLKEYFEKRYSVTAALPDHLQRVIDLEYANYLMSDDRIRKRKKVNFYCFTTEKHLDSVTHGALNSPWGARIALPFYTQFKTFNEAFEFCKKKLEPMIFMGEQACVIWESDIGRQIVGTFVLSEDALKFLVQRDLTAHETVKRTALFAFYWCCFASVAFMLAQIIAHHYFANSTPWFCGISIVLNVPALWGSLENAKFDWHTIDQSADADAARVSVEHGKGGREYYQKMLQRNRLLREIIPDGVKKLSRVGDSKEANTSYWSRFTALVNLDAENKLLDRISAAGDS